MLAHRWLRRARGRLLQFRIAFLFCSATAFGSTLLKPVLAEDIPHEHIVIGVLGAFAIIMPLLAVAALSLAAAMDLEARAHIYKDMREFLEQQTAHLNAASERSYPRLLLETESRLLGETANWFSRRSFAGVA